VLELGLGRGEPDRQLASTWVCACSVSQVARQSSYEQAGQFTGHNPHPNRRRLGGSGAAYAEIPVAWAPDEDSAVQAVLEKSSFALTGWKVMAEQPNPVNFQAATASITPGQVRDQFACGPDVKRHLEVAQRTNSPRRCGTCARLRPPDPDGARLSRSAATRAPGPRPARAR